MPLLKDISAFRAPPTPAHFNEENFLATLEISGPQLTSTIKGKEIKHINSRVCTLKTLSYLIQKNVFKFL